MNRVDILKGLVPYHHVRYSAPCNLNCFFCYERPHPSSVLEETLSSIRESLETARRAGYRVAVFGSGELLMLPFREEAVESARAMGFDEILLITNLTLIDQRKLERLIRAGLTGITGTVFSFSDEDALAIAGKKRISSRQVDGMQLISRYPELTFGIHLLLTSNMQEQLWSAILNLRDSLKVDLRALMISAIEPVVHARDAVLHHPHYTHGLDLDWEELLRKAGQESITITTQNVPACILGAYAHKSYALRKRVARILDGWPKDRELALAVNSAECLYEKIKPEGVCRDCSLLSVCPRLFDYPKKRAVKDAMDIKVVERLLHEEHLNEDPAKIVEALRWIASLNAPSSAAYNDRRTTAPSGFNHAGS